MIIELYDNTQSDYPLIEISAAFFIDFQNDLSEYRTKEEYNIDDFVDLISKKHYFIRTIRPDKEVYF